MIIPALLLASVFLAVVWHQPDQQRSGHVARCMWSLLGFCASLFCLTSPIMALTTLLVGLVAAVCAARNASVAYFRKAALAAVFVSFLVCGLGGIDFQRIAARRAQHPFESMRDRLAYEDRAVAASGKPLLAATAAERLMELERELGKQNTDRVAELQEIHQSYIAHFVNSDGFGVIRMLGRNSSKLFQTVPASIASMGVPSATTDTEPSGGFLIRLAPADYEDPKWAGDYRDPWDDGEDRASKPGPILPTPRDSFLQLHHRGLLGFLNPNDYGYVRNRNAVAGFRPHRFKSSPSFDASGMTERWEIRRLELVSLLKHREPMVYVTDHLPNMDELRKVPTRPLDDIESAMLSRLQQGDDLQLRATKDRIRMLGAMRATSQCLECHRVQRGTLLGAFSYRLSRQP